MIDEEPKMRFLKWLLGIVVLVVLIAGVGGYFFLKNFDLNKYKSYAAKIVYEHTGRKLDVKGDASLGISLIPTLVINDVTLSNPSWAKNPQMAEIGSLELKFSLLPLLKKQIVVDKAVLNGARIYLETAADGKNNWTFEAVKAAQPAKTASLSGGWLIKEAYAEEKATPAPAFLSSLSDVIAREVAVNDSTVQYLAAGSAPLNLQVKSLTFSAEGIQAPMNVTWDAVFNGMDIKGRGNTGSLVGLFNSDQAWPLDMEVTALNVKASVKAQLYDLLNNLRTDFKFNVYNPAGNFNAPETTLIGDGKADLKKVSLNISSLNIVNNVVKGTVSADIAGKVPYIKADLKSPSISLPSFNPQSPTAFVLPQLIKTAAAGDMIPNDKIPYQLLKTANGDLKLSVGKLIVNNDITADDVKLTAALKNGVLNVNPLQMKFGPGTVDLNATVNAAAQSVTLKLDSRNLILQTLHKKLLADGNNFGFISGGQSDIHADLSGRGATYRAVADSLNGSLIAIVDKSVLQSGKLRILTNNFVTQLLGILKIDTSKVEKVQLKCAVVRADFKDGKIDFPKGIAVDSDKLNLVSSGTVNLHDDKLKLNVNAYRSGITDVSILQALSNLVQIGGTLQNPKISLDQGGALRTIAGVAAGPAYAGAQLLLDKDTAPCYTALKGTAYQDRFPKPSGVTGAAQGTYQGAAGLVGDGVTAAKDTAKALENNARQLIKNLLK